MSNLENKENIKLNFFEVIDLGSIQGGAMVSASCEKQDAVWCKAGDSCGTSDKLCMPGWPGGMGHDGCCTGRWDHRGDGRTVIAVTENVTATDATDAKVATGVIGGLSIR